MRAAAQERGIGVDPDTKIRLALICPAGRTEMSTSVNSVKNNGAELLDRSLIPIVERVAWDNGSALDTQNRKLTSLRHRVALGAAHAQILTIPEAA